MAREFKSNIEIKAEKAENSRQFSGIKLLHIRNKVEEMLQLIGREGMFSQYTKHDISHIDEMLRIAEWLIPINTFKNMTYADCLMLVLAIYFHDLGLLVTKKEFENREVSGFEDFKNKVDQREYGLEYFDKENVNFEDKEKFLYQEFIRSIHATRIKNWIIGEFKFCDGNCKEVIDAINDILNPLGNLFRRDLGIICESHHKDDMDNFDIYKTCTKYGNEKDERVNLHYIAIILRTADLLHISMDRTPSVQYRLIDVTNPVSIIEWQKQMGVHAVTPRAKRTEEGIIDRELQSDTIEINAYFTEPEPFFGLMSYIRYAKKELVKNYECIQKSIKFHGTEQYEFPWRYIYDEDIETHGFEPRQLQFNLNQANILQLLVGHTLYNDSSVVIREIIQNALDAIRLQNTIETNQAEKKTEGSVIVSWDSEKRELSFLDNGTGMTIYEVENFLLKVGSSRYRSDEFIKKYPKFNAISRFGIGILTCFLIANDIDIITNSVEEDCAS